MAFTQTLKGYPRDIDAVVKMIMIGDAGVGKSCLLQRYSEDTFAVVKISSSLAIEFDTKIVQIDEKVIKLQMWDTTGQERFTKLTHSYYRGAHGIIIAFDLTDIKSFQNTRSWLNEIDQYGEPHVSKLLVGNKSDLKDKRVVFNETAKELADQIGIPYFETSAKTAINVEKAFLALAAEIKKGFDSGVFKNKIQSIELNEGRHLDEKSWSLSNICIC